MVKKYSVMLLIVLAINLGLGMTISAQTQNSGDIQNLNKMKAKVAKINKQSKKKVVVKYKDGTKLKGVITEVQDDSFTISESKTGKANVVSYSDVSRVEGGGLSTTNKTLIIAGVATAGVLIGFAILFRVGLD